MTHTGVTARLELWNGGSKAADVAATSVQVTADSTATVRRQLRFTAAGLKNLLPTDTTTGHDLTYGTGRYGSSTYGGTRNDQLRGLLLPAITDVRAFYSVDGTETLLGEFRASQVNWTHDTAGVSLDCTAYGVSRRIQKAGWARPFVVGGTGKTIASGIRAIIADRAPGTTVTITGASDQLPRRVLGAGKTSDPWGDVVNLAILAGCEVFDDAAGGVTVRPVPDLVGKSKADADWTFADGVNGTVMRFVDTQDDQDLINTVSVVGASHKHGVFRAVAQITDPGSAWSVDKVGELTYETSDSGYTTVAQCQAAANALLFRLGGMVEAYEVDILPNPRVACGDLVWVTSSKLATDGLYQVRSVDFDPAPGQPTTVTVIRTVGL